VASLSELVRDERNDALRAACAERLDDECDAQPVPSSSDR